MGISMNKFSLDPISTLESSRKTASSELMEISSVCSLILFPEASGPVTRIGRESSKLRSLFATLEAPWKEGLSEISVKFILEKDCHTGFEIYQSLLRMICWVIFFHFFSS